MFFRHPKLLNFFEIICNIRKFKKLKFLLFYRLEKINKKYYLLVTFVENVKKNFFFYNF
jgi:hypothetical protein